MAGKTAIDKLNASVSKILTEYAEDVKGNLGDIVVEMGKKGAQAVRQSSKQNLKQHTGEYAKGWKSTTEKGRLSTSAVIYNEHPALPHLIEYGHVTRNGTGREYPPTPAHEHIAPVAEELETTFVKEVLDKL